MKKLSIGCYFFIFLVINQYTIMAQVTLDNIVTPQFGIGYDFYTVQISSNETKYVFCDTLTNSFSLYNMDFTPFVTNVTVPEPFGNFTFQPIYISRALFDCDTSNIEYAYSSTGGNANNPFYIMRTDGTQLFQIDSANGPFCLGGCLGMSDIIQPIRNTSSGTKLFLQRPNLKIHIYSLCGNLTGEILDYNFFYNSFVKIFPNPTSGMLVFDINLPDNMSEYELVILNTNGSELKRTKLYTAHCKINIDLTNVNNGNYLYSLISKSKIYQSGKFIITK